MRLYDLTGALLDLQTMLEEGVPEEQLTDTMNQITESFNDKAVGVISIIKNMEGFINNIKAEEERLNSKRVSTEKKIVFLKSYLIENMVSSGLKKAGNDILSARVIAGRPMLNLINEELIPDEFRKLTVVSAIDKKGLLAKLKEGEAVEGAEIGTSKTGISIS